MLLILIPFVLLWTTILLWLLAYSYETSNLLSNEAIPLTVVYALFVVSTVALSYFASLKTRQILIVALMIAVLSAPLVLAVANEVSYVFARIVGQDREPKIKRVILLTVDTLRPDVLSSYNPHGLPTPNMDRLAKDGIVFSNAFSAAPWTLPSFSSIMTGLSPFVHRATTSTSKFPDSFKTLAEYVQDAGYYTSAIVWNYYMHPRHNLNQGFLEYDFFPRTIGNSLGLQIFQLLSARFSSPFLNEASTDDLTDLATEWIESNKEKDFFLWLHYYDPHVPYGPPAAFQPKGTSPPRIGRNFFKQNEVRDGKFIPTPTEKEWIKKLYEGEVLYVDENIGKLIDRLQELKIYDESLIVFTSDHGEEFWEHNGYEHGHSLYNEVLWVPLIVKLPMSSSKRRIDRRVSTQGLTPTILEILGIEYEDSDTSTRPFSDLWTDDKPWVDGQPIVSSGLLYGQQRESIIYDGMKYIFSFWSRTEELYDLDQDPGEQVLISDTHGEAIRNARRLLLTHKSAAGRLSYYYLRDKTEDVVMDKDTTEKLKSLGYIQ